MSSSRRREGRGSGLRGNLGAASVAFAVVVIVATVAIASAGGGVD